MIPTEGLLRVQNYFTRTSLPHPDYSMRFRIVPSYSYNMSGASHLRSQNTPATPAKRRTNVGNPAHTHVLLLLPQVPETQTDQNIRAKGKGSNNHACPPPHRQMACSRELRFGTVTIRRYEQTLGDNPACSLGPPLTLDWDFEQDECTPTVDDYEAQIHRRHRNDMMLSYYQRHDILSDKGFTNAQMRTAERQVAKIQWQRTISQSFAPILSWMMAARAACVTMVPM